MPGLDHPIWATIRTVALVVALGLCLKYNYSSFDIEKDPRAMIIMALVYGGMEYVISRAVTGASKK